MKIFQQRKREPASSRRSKANTVLPVPVPDSRILDLDLGRNERQCRCGRGHPEQTDALEDCHGESTVGIATVLAIYGGQRRRK